MSLNDLSGVPAGDSCDEKGQGRVLGADPSNHPELIPRLQVGDTLVLAHGRYPRLTISDLNARPSRLRHVTGPKAGPRASALATAIFRDHDLPLRLAHIFTNTNLLITDGHQIRQPGARGPRRPRQSLFAETPISDLKVAMDFYPLPGKIRELPL